MALFEPRTLGLVGGVLVLLAAATVIIRALAPATTAA